MAATIEVGVDYGQLAVFLSSLQQPFNDWSDQHVAQGFAWRPGSVSFRTILMSGPHSIEISAPETLGAVHPDSIRAIEVPFDVPAENPVEVGSIGDTVVVSLPTGRFTLRCEFLSSESTCARVRLTFGRNENPTFSVVKADDALSIRGDLLTSAKPA